jgi:hypothetical protein
MVTFLAAVKVGQNPRSFVGWAYLLVGKGVKLAAFSKKDRGKMGGKSISTAIPTHTLEIIRKSKP